MTEDPTYDKYLKECFASVAIKFDNVEKSLERIEKHLEKQNHSVAKLQEESNKRAIVVEDFRHLEKAFVEFAKKDGPFDCLEKKYEQLDDKLLEYKFFTKHPKVFFGIIAVIVSTILGLSILNKRDNSDIRKDINYINTVLKIPNAPTRGEVVNDTIK